MKKTCTIPLELLVVASLLLAGISALITMSVYTTIERRKAAAEFEQNIFMCQNSLAEAAEDMREGRDDFLLSPRDRVSRMYDSMEQVQDCYQQRDGMYHARPSLLYIGDLYRFLLVDDLKDAELFDVCTKPFLQTYFEGDLWTFLDDLDSHLQTDDGVKAYAELTGYFIPEHSEPRFVSYCCKYAYFSGIPCMHSESKSK